MSAVIRCFAIRLYYMQCSLCALPWKITSLMSWLQCVWWRLMSSLFVRVNLSYREITVIDLTVCGHSEFCWSSGCWRWWSLSAHTLEWRQRAWCDVSHHILVLVSDNKARRMCCKHCLSNTVYVSRKMLYTRNCLTNNVTIAQMLICTSK